MDDGKERPSSFSWWWDTLNTSTTHDSQWLESTLSEVEHNIKSLLTLVHQEDGDSSAQKAELYYQKKPELVKTVQEFQRLHSMLEEYCTELSTRPSISSISTKQQHHNLCNSHKCARPKSPESIPKSSADYPDYDCVKSIAAAEKYPEKYRSSSCATDEMSSVVSEISEDRSDVNIKDEDVQKKYSSTSSEELVEFCGLANALEWKQWYSEKMWSLVEDSCRQLNELVRGNEEKRRVNRELRSQTEMLSREKHTLVEQHSKLMDENVALQLKLQRLMNENKVLTRYPRVNKNSTSQLSTLRSMFMNKFLGGESP